MKCRSCSETVPDAANFCSNCGARLQGEEPKTATNGIEETISDRRPLTIMFCDLVGSTAMSEELDPEDLQELLLQYQRACAEVVDRFEGYIAQYLGDGILVYFGYPQAHEDDAYRAVLAGLGMIDAMAGLNDTQEHGKDPLQIRIGIHTGLVVTGEIGHGTTETLALGQAPNIAARIQGMTAPDTIAVSDATYALTEQLVEFESLGSPLLKGVSQPLDLYRVVGRKSSRGTHADTGTHQGESVGRRHEVDAIHDCWKQVLDGHRYTVLISGEAGIGKSRLVSMLRDSIGDDTCEWLVTRCSPYSQRTAFGPFAELFGNYFGLDPKSAVDDQIARIRDKLDALGCNSHATFAGLSDILDLDASVALPPDQRKQQVITSLSNLLAHIAAAEPLVLVVEDLHWADSSTIDLLKAFRSDESSARILLVLTFRSSFESPFEEGATCRRINLDPLQETEVKELIRDAAAPAVLDEDIVQLIADRADGVPLFAEELTHMLLASDMLKLENDVLVSRTALDDLSLPSTIHSSLVARLDNLGPVRRVVQHASVVGREFDVELLASISEFDEGTLYSHLETLVDLRVVTRSGNDGSASYNFRHALIRDAAYGTLLKRDKTGIHSKIAETLRVELSETRPEAIAYHFTRADQPQDALEYWHRAGQRSAERFANAEAIKHFGNAIKMIRKLPESDDLLHSEVALQTALGGAVSIHQGWQADAAGEAFERAFDLCQSLPDAPEHFWVLWQLAAHYLTRDIGKTREISQQLIRLAELATSPDLLVEALFSVGAVTLLTGNFEEALAVLTQAEEVIEANLDPSRMSPTGQNIAVNVFGYLGFLYAVSGEPARGMEYSDMALELTRAHAGPPHQAGALCWRGFNLVALGRTESVLELATEALELSESSFVSRQWALMLHGWALAHAGQHDQAAQEIKDAFDAYHGAGIRSLEPWMLTLKADAHLASEAVAECLATVETGLAAAAEIGETFSVPEMHRIRAEALALGGDFDASAGAFEDARIAAIKQGATTLALKASVAYARMLAGREMQSLAESKLSEACEAMGDVPEFPDLREAREFLAGLSRA